MNVMNARPLLAVRRLKVHYPMHGFWPFRKSSLIHAVDGVDFNLAAGESLGIVGESGSGKSSLAKALVGLEKVTSGAIEYKGQNLARLDDKSLRPLRRDIQMIFQDPMASLDPRMSIARSIGEPLRALMPELGKTERDARVLAMMDRVGLDRSLAERKPHEFSGGQCQRVGIARALIVEPRILICDEPVSALDVSVQAQVLNLLQELQHERGLSMLFIAHDLAVVRKMSQRVLVMYLGRIMEQADREALFAQPMHPYTRALMASIPGEGDPELAAALEGDLPNPAEPPAGCAFVGRCPMADERCVRMSPHLRRVGHGGYAACHYIEASSAAA